MPARKPTKRRPAKPQKLNVPIVALYAVPIYNAIKRGDAAEMKALAAQARKHVSDVSAALAALEKRIGQGK
jgi:hypothetical protein